MKSHVGSRIKSARMLAGLSLRELSVSLNGIVTHTAISKYEKGMMMPDSKILIALSNALDVKTDYFFRSQAIELSNIEFRKKSSLNVKKVNSITENIRGSIERYIELESFFNFQIKFSNPIKNLPIRNADDVENAVISLLNKWNLGINAIPNVIEILEDNDVKVVEIDVDEKFDGLSGWVNHNIPIIVINKKFTVERKRFTALHELGHLLLNINKDVFNHKEIEKFCNIFAGAMLLPKETLFNELGKKRNAISLNELIYIKESFGISIQAIMARAKDLDVVTLNQYVKFRIRVNQDPNLKKEIGYGEYKGVEYSSRFKQLLYRATAEEIISMSKAASLSNVKLAQFRDEFMVL